MDAALRISKIIGFAHRRISIQIDIVILDTLIISNRKLREFMSCFCEALTRVNPARF